MTRAAVVDAAIAAIGADTPTRRVKYWESALGRKVTYEEIRKMAWCGGFALYCLHEAGHALDTHWRIGAGFLLQSPHPLTVVKVPAPGDIGYQNSPFQHHFITESCDGQVVHSIDGNQPDVRRRTRTLGPAVVYYDIASLLRDTIPSPSMPAPRGTDGAVQHSINSLIMKHLVEHDTPKILTVDGIVGPRTTAAIVWAQRRLGVTVNGIADDETQKALGL